MCNDYQLERYCYSSGNIDIVDELRTNAGKSDCLQPFFSKCKAHFQSMQFRTPDESQKACMACLMHNEDTMFNSEELVAMGSCMNDLRDYCMRTHPSGALAVTTATGADDDTSQGRGDGWHDQN